jgi:hypothetical protein
MFDELPIFLSAEDVCAAAWRAAIEFHERAGTLAERKLELAMYGINKSLAELREENFSMARKRLAQIVEAIEKMT